MTGFALPRTFDVAVYLCNKVCLTSQSTVSKGISPFVSAPLLHYNDELTGDAAGCHRTSACYHFTSERDARLMRLQSVTLSVTLQPAYKPKFQPPISVDLYGQYNV